MISDGNKVSLTTAFGLIDNIGEVYETQMNQYALYIRAWLFWKERPDIVKSYYLLGVTQHESSDFASALYSPACGLNISEKNSHERLILKMFKCYIKTTETQRYF